MTEPSFRRVHRRRVFYLPGYDPFPPRRYRELYRSEGAAQAAISGYSLTLSARRDDGPYGWHVHSIQDAQTVETDVEVLLWSDIVQGSMGGSIAATYGQMLRTAWIYIASGALWPLMRLRKGPVIAALYPIAMLSVQALVAAAIGLGTAALALRLIPGWPAIVGGLVAFVLVLRWFRAQDRRLFAYYLMHDFAFSARWRGAYPSELESRIAAFRHRIAGALTEDWDEVLVVGHSSGAHIGVSVLADLLRAHRLPLDGPVLAFLTLGQVVPMVSFLPKAHRLRADLADLAGRGELTWIDVSAPGDGCSFALCDPVKVTGVAPPAQKWPLVISAAFTKTLSAERWRALRWRFFRLHFQYLCAFDRPGDYDYFQITAGPETLAERFADRHPSRSRVERDLSPYRSVA